MKKITLSLLPLAMLLLALLSGCGEEEAVVDYFTPGDYMVVNIAESYRLLKIAPVMVLNADLTKKFGDSEVTLDEELTAAQPLIRDVVNRIVRTKTLEELSEAAALDNMRAEIITALQEELGMSYVTDVYFSDFVVQ
jgi:flagellar basal body-associated protein FliL